MRLEPKVQSSELNPHQRSFVYTFCTEDELLPLTPRSSYLHLSDAMTPVKG